MNVWNILLLILLSVLPFIELRLSIPVGILRGSVNVFFGITASGMGLPPLFVFCIAVITNTLLGIVIFNVLTRLDKRLRASSLQLKYLQLLDKSREKMQPYVRKYGLLGASLFIALPIPGSGVYLGAIGSYVVGIPKQKYYIANLLGVFFAALLVTFLTISGQTLFG